jgi:chromosome segregation ATPase
MAIPSVVQGLIETEDGKVFELDSPKGVAWVETTGSFRFEPAGDGKPYTVRREPSGYWYGCRKIAGKVRKKYIGKSLEVTVDKLEEIAEALEVPPVSRTSKVVGVAQEVTEVAQEVAEVTQDRFTALELQVANLQKTVEALQDALPGKLDSGNSLELPKVDSEVVERLQNELGNLKKENEKLRADYDALLESSTVITNKLREELREVRSQLEKERANQEEVEAEREELAQLKKQVKEHAAEVHFEGRSIELEKDRWQGELSEARSDLAAAKATIAQQGGKIRELERGYSFKPNPAEQRLRLEIGELQTQLSDLKQKSATAGKDLPDAADLLNQLKTRRKKSKSDLTDLEVILEILEG